MKSSTVEISEEERKHLIEKIGDSRNPTNKTCYLAQVMFSETLRFYIYIHIYKKFQELKRLMVLSHFSDISPSQSPVKANALP